MKYNWIKEDYKMIESSRAPFFFFKFPKSPHKTTKRIGPFIIKIRNALGPKQLQTFLKNSGNVESGI